MNLASNPNFLAYYNQKSCTSVLLLGSEQSTYTSNPCEIVFGCSTFLLISTEISDTLSILWCLANLQMAHEWDRSISSVIKALLSSFLYTPSWAQTPDMCTSSPCTTYCSESNVPPSLSSLPMIPLLCVLEIARRPVYQLQPPFKFWQMDYIHCITYTQKILQIIWVPEEWEWGKRT